MKKKIILIVSILCMFFLSSCIGKEKKEELMTGDLGEIKKQDTVDKLEEDNIGKNKIENNEVEETLVVGRAWGKDMEGFKGISSEYPSPTYGNLKANIKGQWERAQFSLMCVNEDTGVVYYVNIGEDNYIYQLDGNKRTLLVEEEANYIQIWNNELYFLKGESIYPDILLKPYPLYKYNLETKEIILVLEEEVTDFCITSEGIYYSVLVEIEENREVVKYYLRSFETDAVEEVRGYSYIKYKEYQLEIDENPDELLIDIFLKNIHTGDTIHVASNVWMFSQISIVDNHMIFSDKNEIYYINLETGKRFSVILDEYVLALIKSKRTLNDYDDMTSYNIISYTVIDDIIYITGAPSGIISIHINTQEVNGFMPLNTGKSRELIEMLDDKYPLLEEQYGLETFFSSGNRLFAFSSSRKDFQSNGLEVIEIIIREDGYYVILIEKD